MSGWSRRAVLGGLAGGIGLGGLLSCAEGPPPAPTVGVLGAARAARGHRLRAPFSPGSPSQRLRPAVCVIGGGVAGLSAIWRLRRAGFEGEVVLVELDEALGGTSQAGGSAAAPFALGGHYATLPNAENLHVRAIFEDLGVFLPADPAGPPRVAPGQLCLAPQERVFVGGQWWPGLWPAEGASAADEAQRAHWEARVEALRATVGADGKPAFSLPVARASHDPTLRALADQSMAAWLDAEGLDSPRLRWLVEYACRDDFGTTLQTTSAWAGLHYHCARRPSLHDDRDLGTHVLTWPAGNGLLVAGLAARAPATRLLGAVCRRVEPDTGRVWVEQGESLLQIDAAHVVLAVPAPVAARLLDRPDPGAPTAAPWRVAVLHLDGPARGPGVPAAWDSVVYQPELPVEEADLGAIDNEWQRGAYGGAGALTWYQPLCGADPAAERAALLASTPEEQAALVLRRMRRGWPGLPERLRRIELWAWGHGTVRPTVGLHSAPAALAARAAPLGRVWRAHTDLSGMSLFEEASYHGVRVAEAILAERGLPVERPLAGAPA